MTCREFEDAMEDHFGSVDANQMRDLIVKDQWHMMPPSAVRDHLASCSDCPQSLLQFLQARGSLDYRSQPCFHVAYYSASVPERCLDKELGMYAIITERTKREGIVIGFSPWCGVVLPTTPTSGT
jgi:hypothetical protein